MRLNRHFLLNSFKLFRFLIHKLGQQQQQATTNSVSQMGLQIFYHSVFLPKADGKISTNEATFKWLLQNFPDS